MWVSLEKRFWSKVAKLGDNECWEWQAGKSYGYGAFFIDGNNTAAHRVAWKLHNQCDIPEGKRILHKCDNPGCCNPKHLYCGTQSDNMQDVAIRERGRRSKLNMATVLLVRGLKKFRFSKRHAALLAEVTPGQVNNIWRSKRHSSTEGCHV